MGFDSVAPYLRHEGKGAFLLCRTSNPGGADLQGQRLASVEGEPLLYEHVARLAQGPWNLNGQLGLVVGATYPAEIERVRALAPTRAAADPRRRRAGRRCGGHGARRLARRCADRRQFVARDHAMPRPAPTSPRPRGAQPSARATVLAGRQS